jgi:hypothetical protein
MIDFKDNYEVSACSRGQSLLTFMLAVTSPPTATSVEQYVQDRVSARRLSNLCLLLSRGDNVLYCCSLIERAEILKGTLGRLFHRTTRKAERKRFLALLSILLYQNNRDLLSIYEGHFEHMVNISALPSLSVPVERAIMGCINGVLHNHSSSAPCAEIAGSRSQHLDVSGYSDLDVFVHCNDEISQTQRTDISTQILNRLRTIFPNVEMSYLYHSTEYSWNDMSFDMVFEKAEFTHDDCPAPSERRAQFSKRPDLQRVVRAFKILMKEVIILLSYPCHDTICINVDNSSYQYIMLSLSLIL